MRSDHDGRRTSTRMTKSKKKKRTPLVDLTNACTPFKQLKSAAPPPSVPGDTPVPGPDPGVPTLSPEPPASFLDAGQNAANNDKPQFSTVYTRRKCSEERIISKEKKPCTTSLLCKTTCGNPDNNDKPEFSTVYTRQKRSEEKIISKEKEPCTTSSCSPVERTRSFEKGKQVDHTDSERQKAFSVSLQRPKKKQRCVSSTPIKPMLPRDFVEKQKAYFAEVDAFELLEEVASDSEEARIAPT